ncbi:hypothetical protein PG996_010985 [Apiospora saccharicola]|uniref:Uncharacterized protein n=1 Tax=Apiospora saccharicola TaxID=335842 RepID=A0ABR1UGK4_9PEZI
MELGKVGGTTHQPKNQMYEEHDFDNDEYLISNIPETGISPGQQPLCSLSGWQVPLFLAAVAKEDADLSFCINSIGKLRRELRGFQVAVASLTDRMRMRYQVLELENYGHGHQEKYAGRDDGFAGLGDEARAAEIQMFDHMLVGGAD